MKIKIYQFIYINFFILVLNFKKKLDVSNNIKKDLERNILFKHIISLKYENFEYDIKENNEKNEILIINKSLPIIGLSLITEYENELLFKSKANKKNKDLDSNIVYLDDFKRKKKSKLK